MGIFSSDDMDMVRHAMEVEARNRIEYALKLGLHYGSTDGSHHKMWVIDQMVRILAGDKYDERVKNACNGEDGPDTYEWDTGIAP